MATPPGLNVNPVFLEQLRSSRTALERLQQVPPPSNETQALVLFRPLALPPSSDPELAAESVQEEGDMGDAMDLDL